MISTRSAGLLIDTVVCLTLAKWETVSGRFGGYLMPLGNKPGQMWTVSTRNLLDSFRRKQQTGDVSLDPLRWGLIPYWCNDPMGGRKPINAKCETVRDLPTFREAYRKRRCIVPVDGFFEWKAIKGQKAKQPYAIAMKDGAPFGIAGIWEN